MNLPVTEPPLPSLRLTGAFLARRGSAFELGGTPGWGGADAFWQLPRAPPTRGVQPARSDVRARPTGAALLGNANNVSGMCQVKSHLVEGAHTAPKVRLSGLNTPLAFEPTRARET